MGEHLLRAHHRSCFVAGWMAVVCRVSHGHNSISVEAFVKEQQGCTEIEGWTEIIRIPTPLISGFIVLDERVITTGVVLLLAAAAMIVRRERADPPRVQVETDNSCSLYRYTIGLMEIRAMFMQSRTCFRRRNGTFR